MIVFMLIWAFLLLFAADWRTDIEYARKGDESLTLDASVPEGPGPFPTVIIVHGGGFTAGDKGTYVKPLFPLLTNAGFTWFTINYRLAPQYHFPAPVEDVEDAVRWVKKHAREYKVDPKRVALLGESAGGHLVSYVGTTSARDLGLAAVVPFYAPHDLLARAEEQGKVNQNISGFLGIGPELNVPAMKMLESASPYSHAQKGMPPFLLIHGTKDAAVAYSQSVRMQQKLKGLGVTCDLYTVEGAPHGMEGWEKNADWQTYKPYLVDWLKKTLR
jgi:acetyl esterase